MYHMRTISVRDLRYDFKTVERILLEGEDIQITKQLTESGKILGIPVHDHIIFTKGGFASFAERGLL